MLVAISKVRGEFAPAVLSCPSAINAFMEAEKTPTPPKRTILYGCHIRAHKLGEAARAFDALRRNFLALDIIRLRGANATLQSDTSSTTRHSISCLPAEVHSLIRSKLQDLLVKDERRASRKKGTEE